VDAIKSDKCVVAFRRFWLPGFWLRFSLPILVGDGVSQKSRLSSFRKPSESRSAERIKLDDDGRTEWAF
jgi:hypothetical protein